MYTTERKKKSEFSNQNKKALGCSGSHHFQNWRQGFGKKSEMLGSARSVPLYILFDIESVQSHIPPTDVINFVCQTMNEAVLRVQ